MHYRNHENRIVVYPIDDPVGPYQKLAEFVQVELGNLSTGARHRSNEHQAPGQLPRQLIRPGNGLPRNFRMQYPQAGLGFIREPDC